MYNRGLICLYLCAEAGLAGVLRELPFCLDHVVVGTKRQLTMNTIPPRLIAQVEVN